VRPKPARLSGKISTSRLNVGPCLVTLTLSRTISAEYENIVPSAQSDSQSFATSVVVPAANVGVQVNQRIRVARCRHLRS
jgi:hypothetical protein